jgi:hypothetical protein
MGQYLPMIFDHNFLFIVPYDTSYHAGTHISPFTQLPFLYSLIHHKFTHTLSLRCLICSTAPPNVLNFVKIIFSTIYVA